MASPRCAAAIILLLTAIACAISTPWNILIAPIAATSNGLLAYVQEIAGRTEQYWCPIKHAINLKARHSRYQHFLDYGDAEQYRKRIEEIRRDFADVKKPDGSHSEEND